MPKWFDETILIKYWEDRCSQYELQGIPIKSAKRNPAFGRYPDITQNFLTDGRVVPAEIEWTTTDFDRHKHDISVLRDDDGFLVVFKQDAGFALSQVEINESDFTEWYTEHAEELCQETLDEITKISNEVRNHKSSSFTCRNPRPVKPTSKSL